MTQQSGQPGQQFDWRPTPDPTVLTTEAVNAATVQYRRELDALREVLTQRISQVVESYTAADASRREVYDERFDGLRQVLRGEIKNVLNVCLEKFSAIEGTFASNALALTAALATQKEAAAEQNKSSTLAIAKSEKATSETIAANAAQNAASAASQAATIADLKDRLVRLESGGTAVRDARSDQRADSTLSQDAAYYRSALQRSLVSLGIAVLALVATIVIAFVVHR